jgi:hypothetical protein
MNAATKALIDEIAMACFQANECTQARRLAILKDLKVRVVARDTAHFSATPDEVELTEAQWLKIQGGVSRALSCARAED